MDKIEEFIKRLKDLEDEIGVYLRLNITKHYVNNELQFKDSELYVINPKSVYVKPILKVDMNKTVDFNSK